MNLQNFKLNKKCLMCKSYIYRLTSYFASQRTCLLSFHLGDLKAGCSKACTYLDVTYGYPFIYELKNGSPSSITLYFKTSVVVRESHLAYDVGSLLAEIGGYTGLLLGISLLDFAKIFKIFLEGIQRVWRNSKKFNFYQNCSPQKNQTLENVKHHYPMQFLILLNIF